MNDSQNNKGNGSTGSNLISEVLRSCRKPPRRRGQLYREIMVSEESTYQVAQEQMQKAGGRRQSGPSNGLIHEPTVDVSNRQKMHASDITNAKMRRSECS